MRILAITHNFPNEGNQNHGIFAARQLLEMRNQGAELEIMVPAVYCPSWMRRFKRWQEYNHKWKCEYKSLKGIEVPFLRLPGRWYYPWMCRAVYHAVKPVALKLHHKRAFDLIYGRFFFPDGYAAYRLSKILNIPAVAVGAGDDVNRDPLYSKWVQRDLSEVANNIGGLLASGQAAANSIEQVCNRKVLPVYGVVDINQFHPIQKTAKQLFRAKLGLPLNKIILLYIGTYKVEKGVLDMINAFMQIKDRVPQAVFVIRGYGRQEVAMREIVSKYDAQNQIIIGDQILADDVPQFMQATDLFILASHMEGMPNAVMEAMACGLPIVATAVGGLPSALHDCEGAILVEPHNTSALANAMLQVIQNNLVREKMSIAASKKAAASFTVQQNVKTVLAYFEKVIALSKDKL